MSQVDIPVHVPQASLACGAQDTELWARICRSDLPPQKQQTFHILISWSLYSLALIINRLCCKMGPVPRIIAGKGWTSEQSEADVEQEVIL